MGGEKSSWTSHVASRDGRARLPLLVFFRGQRVSAMRDEALRVLTALYEAVAAVDPRWEVVPLFEFCGWSRQTIVERFNVDSFEEVRPECDQRELSPEWKSRLLPLCTVEPEVEGCSTSYSPMDEVCVGGTFDRLHAGHRLLLSATVAVCDKTIFVGITADVLLAKKKNRELLEPYGVRKGCVEDFIRAMNPNLKVASGELGLHDPGAVTSASMDGIVVSRETVAGAKSINDEREKANYKALVVIPVNLVGATSQEGDAKKLSSSDLRQMDSVSQARGAKGESAP